MFAMQTLIIGDIHGCYVEFQSLLDKAGLSDDDRIITTGDFIDRGSETPQVVDFFQHTSNACTLMGNHEYKHLRAMRGEIKLALTQRIACYQLGEAYPETMTWIAGLPFYLELPEVVLVHGHLEPGVPLVEQNLSVLLGMPGGDIILRNRYDRPWYTLYDGAKPLIVGHHNYLDSDQPLIYHDRVYGLDTSCVKGKALTGLLLPSFRILSVPSRGNLWGRVHREYERREHKGVPPRDLPWSDADNQSLARLITKIETLNKVILSRLEATPTYEKMNVRQRAKLFKAEVGDGSYGRLMQMARAGNLDLDRARKALRDPKLVYRLLADS
jgi:predicted phosphodiesterase